MERCIPPSEFGLRIEADYDAATASLYPDLSDRSRKGMEESVGIMINYVYKLSEIDGNHEAYAASGKIAVSSGVNSLSKGGG